MKDWYRRISFVDRPLRKMLVELMRMQMALKSFKSNIEF